MKKLFLFLLCAGMFFLANQALAKLYKYVDDNGVVHYTNDPYSVPEKYRQRLKLVEKQILKEREITHPKKFGWQKWVERNENGELGINLKKMFTATLFGSKLAFWILAEILLLAIFIILLLVIKNFPTKRERILWSTSLVIGWLALSGLIFKFLLLPSVNRFFYQARVELKDIAFNAPLDNQSKKALLELEEKLKQFQKRVF